MFGRVIGANGRIFVRQRFAGRAGRRSYHVEEYKPPTYDQLPAPYAPWKEAYAEAQKRNNRTLAFGLVTFSITMAYYLNGGVDFVLPPPMKNEK